MVGIFEEIDWYAALEEFLGHPPKYFQKIDFHAPCEGDGNVGVLVAYHLEVERSVRRVSEMFFNYSHKRLRKESMAVGFKFDEMIEDDVKSGMSHRELKKIHMIGGKRIKEIADRVGPARQPRNSSKKHSDEHIEKVYRQNNNNATRTGKILGITRMTVTAAIRR
ncbi:hypothetical protein [Loktanella sp. S4079]|uniref:hypothetical protein n=1 Tax=Loktanella sp. S4079 TaxID=579483 RepID=UPI0005F9B933|nr:hypothetical protein [Loktanella sp. S4079]KJZ17242.1 hypothetical protein TW80_17115 [Loktanella sp. S4079]